VGIAHHPMTELNVSDFNTLEDFKDLRIVELPVLTKTEKSAAR
jgi:hypothetical protein